MPDSDLPMSKTDKDTWDAAHVEVNFLEGKPQAISLTSVTQHLISRGFMVLEAGFDVHQGKKNLKNKTLRFILTIAMNISYIKVADPAT